MTRVQKRAAEVAPELAPVVGSETLAVADGVSRDEPVLTVEAISLEDAWAADVAEREAANRKAAAAWANVGAFAPSRPATPARGSRCGYCGSTTSVLASQQASGPYLCAFGCSRRSGGG